MKKYKANGLKRFKMVNFKKGIKKVIYIGVQSELWYAYRAATRGKQKYTRLSAMIWREWDGKKTE